MSDENLQPRRHFASKSIVEPTFNNNAGIGVNISISQIPTAKKRIFPAKNFNVSAVTQVKKIRAPGEGGSLTLKEIRKCQRANHLLIPRGIFIRLIRELANGVTNGKNFMWKGLALIALQEAAEHYLVDMFEGANLLALHTGRITLMPKDVKLLRTLRKEAKIQIFTKTDFNFFFR